MKIRRGVARRHHEARVRWLTAHPDALLGVPGIRDDVNDDGRACLLTLTAALRDAGLLGSAQTDVQRETVRRLVSELRGEHIGAEGW
jgi:hypothetical protein